MIGLTGLTGLGGEGVPDEGGASLFPTDPDDRARCEHTAARRAMLYGQWREALIAEIGLQAGPQRQGAWRAGTVDMSRNLLRKAASSRATLHDKEWTITHDDPVAAAVVAETCRLEQVGPLLQRLQRDVVGLREGWCDALGVARSDGSYRVAYRTVFADDTTAEASPVEPDRPVVVREKRRRYVNGKPKWVWDVYRADAPMVCEDQSGAVIPGIADDRTGIPLVLFHAARTASVFDAFEECELYYATLEIGVKWTYIDHVFLDCSHPQRWSMGVIWTGGVSTGRAGAERLEIVTDPGTILQGTKDPNWEGQPVVNQFQPGGDPKTMAETAILHEQGVGTYLDLDPADGAAKTTGDPRSAYAMVISDTAKRRAQERYAPVWRPSCEALCGRTAEELNRVAGLDLPTTGYRVEFWFEREERERREAMATAATKGATEADHAEFGTSEAVKAKADATTNDRESET